MFYLAKLSLVGLHVLSVPRLHFIYQRYVSENRVHGKSHSLKAAVEYAGQSPAKCCSNAEVVHYEPISAAAYAVLYVPHVVREIVVAAFACRMSEVYFRACRIADTQPSVVCEAGEMVREHPADVRARVQTHVARAVPRSLHRQGEHPLPHLCCHVACEHAVEFLAAARYVHIIVFHARIGLHSLVLKPYAAHQSPVV